MKIAVLLLAGCIAVATALGATANASNARGDANVANAASAATPKTAESADADAADADAETETESAQDDAQAQASLEAWQSYRNQVIDAMIDSASPREWAMAAGDLSYVDDTASAPLRPTRAALLQRASDRAPGDALVQWLVAIDRLSTNTCKASPAPDENVHALLRVEPGNAAAWMLALAIAAQRNDNAGIDDALAHMASSSVYDEHFGDNLVARMEVYDRFPMPDFSSEQDDPYGFAISDAAKRSLASFTSAMAEASATAMPSYSKLIKVCKPAHDTSDNWQRYAYCEDAARLMLSKGTTLIAHGIGFAVLRNLGENVLTPEDQKARQNDYWWREQAMTTFMLDAERGNSATFVADWRSTRDEIEVSKRALRRNGLDTEAPAGWIPSWTQPSVAMASGSD